MSKRTTSNVINQLKKEIEKRSEVALFSHVSPDGDCIGSMLAIGTALEYLGKKVHYYNAGPLPENLSFLPGIEHISTSLCKECPDTLFFIDCAEAERAHSTMTKEFLQGKNVINIDHHVSNDFFGTINWVDPEAGATGEMIYFLLKNLSIPISKDIAINLYTAIITDTGRFSFSNTTVRSFKIAADLLTTGIDLVSINNMLFEQKTLAQTKLLQKALSNMEFHQDGTIAMIVLSKRDFEESGAEENLSEGLVNYARNIENVEAAVLLKEIDDTNIKVSFRSNSSIDVNAVAHKFGGGGHIRASGCTINLSLVDAKKTVVNALEEALNLGRDH